MKEKEAQILRDNNIDGERIVSLKASDLMDFGFKHARSLVMVKYI